jgi:predicted HicB family RNase H-like nuclease
MTDSQKARSRARTTTASVEQPKVEIEQLNVRIPLELFRRINAVAGAIGKSQAQFVAEVLDDRTKEHKSDVDRIAERERKSKKWQ